MAFKTFYPYKFAKEANSWLGLPSLVRMYRLKRKKKTSRGSKEMTGRLRGRSQLPHKLGDPH